MASADLVSYRWLISTQAERWLAYASETQDSVAKQVKTLRRDLSSMQAHLVLEQVELRRRAAAKFSLAGRMFFTRRALAQSTSEVVAEWKARRVASLRDNTPIGNSYCRCADLCSGIGGDLLAFAALGPAMGVERDEVVAELARANLAVHGCAAAEVICSDVRAYPVEEAGIWHLDPDRRTDQGRVAQPEFAEPPLEDIERLLNRNSCAAIKLAPAGRVPLRWTGECELEWISERGECKQQVAWFGQLARFPGMRAATILAGGRSARTICGSPEVRPAVCAAVQRYVYDADAAIFASQLQGVLAREYNLLAIESEVGYLTSDRLIGDAPMAAFEVLEVASFDRKQLKAMLRHRRVGYVEIKKRGIDLDVARLQRELQTSEGDPATVLLTPLAGKVVAIVARRVGQDQVVAPALRLHSNDEDSFH